MWMALGRAVTVAGLSAAENRQSRQFESSRPAGFGMRQNAHLHLATCVGFYLIFGIFCVFGLESLT